MADLEAEYRVTLKRHFDLKISKNKRYSLRSFAKFLGVDPTYLSKLFSGKLLLSLDSADRITKKLKLEGKERATFLLSAAEEQKCHALYLIDPLLTDCHPATDEVNRLPKSRRHKP
ncbi:MAG: helix-turn-helix domain-containing protein [Proteobacteria bacterium]|nr:helix-turn-helix domain-containing protein [Pseudomonadota bacterium]